MLQNTLTSVSDKRENLKTCVYDDVEQGVNSMLDNLTFLLTCSNFKL